MTRPKPAHLGRTYGDQFRDPAIVAAYGNRPPYPAGVFNRLEQLLVPGGAILDLGCGTGDVARPLAQRGIPVDAVDCSSAMLDMARRLPGGDLSHLTWLQGMAEDVDLPRKTYGLVTAGESLHWMEWEQLLPRLSGLLVPGGLLAIVARIEQPTPWREALGTLIQRHSTNRVYQPYNVIDELTSRGLFTEVGRERVMVTVRQTVETYVESMHSRNGFSRDRMHPDDAAAFDRAFRALLAPYAQDGYVSFGGLCGIPC